MDLNLTKSGLEKRFLDLCEPIVIEAGYRLYDMEYAPQQKVLRLFIEDPRTSTAVIEDCIKVDHLLSPVFETENWIPDEIVLEVSSPGMFRDLKTTEHLQAAVGKKILVVIKGQLKAELLTGLPKSFEKEKKWRGELLEFNDKSLALLIKDKKISIEFEQIKNANLDPDF